VAPSRGLGGTDHRLLGLALDAFEDSEEAFIAEHYWGYSRQRDGATVEYQVEHPRWRVWRAEAAALSCDVAALYGAEFVDGCRARRGRRSSPMDRRSWSAVAD
jgi:hypothetical protein